MNSVFISNNLFCLWNMWKEITKENKWLILKHFWFVWQIILVNGTNFTHAITQFRSNKKKNFIIMMTKLHKQKQAIKNSNRLWYFYFHLNHEMLRNNDFFLLHFSLLLSCPISSSFTYFFMRICEKYIWKLPYVFLINTWNKLPYSNQVYEIRNII